MLLYAFQHQVPDVIAAVACRAGDPANSFVVTAVQGKSYTQLRTVVAAELESIRTPPSIAGSDGDSALMSARYAGLLDSSRQQQVVIAHNAIDPFHVDQWQRLDFAFATQHAPNTTVA
ncbi:hypothetical protein UB48_24330 [Pseudomonas sp. 2(2015)]|nr:hypothetical protein UB48_24330 [Pseudomonas sp. 2(2015)]